MSHQQIERNPSPKGESANQMIGDANQELGTAPSDASHRTLSHDHLSAGAEPFIPVTGNNPATRGQLPRPSPQRDLPPHITDTGPFPGPEQYNNDSQNSRARGSTIRVDPHPRNTVEGRSENSGQSRSHNGSKESSIAESVIKSRSQTSTSQPNLTIGSEPTVRFDELDGVISDDRLLGLRQLVSQHSFQRRELSTAASYLRQMTGDTQSLQAQVGELSGRVNRVMSDTVRFIEDGDAIVSNLRNMFDFPPAPTRATPAPSEIWEPLSKTTEGTQLRSASADTSVEYQSNRANAPMHPQAEIAPVAALITDDTLDSMNIEFPRKRPDEDNEQLHARYLRHQERLGSSHQSWVKSMPHSQKAGDMHAYPDTIPGKPVTVDRLTGGPRVQFDSISSSKPVPTSNSYQRQSAMSSAYRVTGGPPESGLWNGNQYHQDILLPAIIKLIEWRVGTTMTAPPGVKQPKIGEPEKFSGTSDHELFLRWLEKFLSWLRSHYLCGPDVDSTRLNLLGNFLSGSALEWYNADIDHPEANDGIPYSFEEAICHMHIRFVKTATAASAKVKFDEVRYNSTEGPEGLYYDLKTWARRMIEYPGEYAMKVRLFRGLPVDIHNGLIDREITPEYSTLEDIRQNARQIDENLGRHRNNARSSAKSSDTTHSNTTRPTAKALTTTARPEARPATNRSVGSISRTPTNRPKRDLSKVQCFGCRAFGHLASDPTCPEFSSRTRLHAQRVTEVQDEELTPYHTVEDLEDDEQWGGSQYDHEDSGENIGDEVVDDDDPNGPPVDATFERSNDHDKEFDDTGARINSMRVRVNAMRVDRDNIYHNIIAEYEDDTIYETNDPIFTYSLSLDESTTYARPRPRDNDTGPSNNVANLYTDDDDHPPSEAGDHTPSGHSEGPPPLIAVDNQGIPNSDMNAVAPIIDDIDINGLLTKIHALSLSTDDKDLREIDTEWYPAHLYEALDSPIQVRIFIIRNLEKDPSWDILKHGSLPTGMAANTITERAVIIRTPQDEIDDIYWLEQLACHRPRIFEEITGYRRPKRNDRPSCLDCGICYPSIGHANVASNEGTALAIHPFWCQNPDWYRDLLTNRQVEKPEVYSPPSTDTPTVRMAATRVISPLIEVSRPAETRVTMHHSSCELNAEEVVDCIIQSFDECVFCKKCTPTLEKSCNVGRGGIMMFSYRPFCNGSASAESLADNHYPGRILFFPEVAMRSSRIVYASSVKRKAVTLDGQPNRTHQSQLTLTAEIEINGVKAFTLFDSGSTTDSLSPEFAHITKARITKLEDQIVLQLGCVGSRSKINYGTNTPVNTCGIHEEVYFDIVNLDRYDCIIGTPFMNKYGVSIDFKSKTIRINGQSINALSFDEERLIADAKRETSISKRGTRAPPRDTAAIVTNRPPATIKSD